MHSNKKINGVERGKRHRSDHKQATVDFIFVTQHSSCISVVKLMHTQSFRVFLSYNATRTARKNANRTRRLKLDDARPKSGSTHTNILAAARRQCQRTHTANCATSQRKAGHSHTADIKIPISVAEALYATRNSTYAAER